MNVVEPSRSVRFHSGVPARVIWAVWKAAPGAAVNENAAPRVRPDGGANQAGRAGPAETLWRNEVENGAFAVALGVASATTS